MKEEAKIVEIASNYNYHKIRNIWKIFHVVTSGFLGFKDLQEINVVKNDIIFIWEDLITKTVKFHGWLKPDGAIKKCNFSGLFLPKELSTNVKEWTEMREKHFFEYTPEHYYKY